MKQFSWSDVIFDRLGWGMLLSWWLGLIMMMCTQLLGSLGRVSLWRVWWPGRCLMLRTSSWTWGEWKGGLRGPYSIQYRWHSMWGQGALRLSHGLSLWLGLWLRQLGAFFSLSPSLSCFVSPLCLEDVEGWNNWVYHIFFIHILGKSTENSPVGIGFQWNSIICKMEHNINLNALTCSTSPGCPSPTCYPHPPIGYILWSGTPLGWRGHPLLSNLWYQWGNVKAICYTRLVD